MSEIKNIIEDARRWIEQERAWDNEVYATPGTSPRAAHTPLLTGEGNDKSTPSPIKRGSREAGGEVKAAALRALYNKYNTCVRCPLGESRIKFVFGVGSPDAEALLIGEGPGFDEDHKGEPFVGRSGQLLDKMLGAIGLSRKTVFIANVVKCHPMINPKTPEERGNDRPPTPLEVATCSPILQQQIAVIQPKVIFTLGSPSTKAILGTQEGISKVRGRLYPMPMTYFNTQLRDDFPGLTPEQLALLEKIQVLPTYHPAALLRNPNLKKDAWDDLKLLRDTLNKPA